MIPVFFCCMICIIITYAQQNDTTVSVGKKMIILTELVVNNHINVPAFIEKVKNDTTFYKAFRNLYILGYTSLNDIRILDKKGNSQATLYSRTKQIRQNGCRSMQILEEQATGDMYDKDHNFNYYTAQLYASRFFTKGTICGENNIVTGRAFSTKGKSGMDKQKEQLKMLLFNPGKRINGLPFISDKTAIFDDDMADKYDMKIDMEEHNKTSCYVFTIKAKPGSEGDVVIDEMVTWFNDRTFEVIARNYTLSYNASVYDFKVNMEVQMTHIGELLVPALIRYNGNWKVLFKGRERGIFTATLFDFND
ncbi:MAG: hypothetical protein HY305_02895 [Sphingobacteriales bacterium]|nr:hypothetical protein [Sphingobacteriales bacterium]